MEREIKRIIKIIKVMALAFAIVLMFVLGLTEVDATSTIEGNHAKTTVSSTSSHTMAYAGRLK